jgi:hypothetical protein
MSHGFPRRLRKDRRKRGEKHQPQPRPQLPPTNNVSTGEPQLALQTPTHSDIRRISTATLIKELQRRDSRGLIAAIAEANANRL